MTSFILLLQLSYRKQSIDLLCSANQWTGFYLITTSVMKELRYYTSCFSYLIWIFNDSSSFCLADEFDPDGAFPSVLLMFSNLNICVVSCLLTWMLVSLDFLFTIVLLLFRFDMSE